MAKKQVKKKARAISAPQAAAKKSSGSRMILAIVALVLNILMPGVGSVVAGKTKEGIWQLVIVAIGLIVTLLFTLKFIGLIIVVAAELWGIFTAITLIKEA